MTREETKKILMNIECSYPNWKPQGDLGFMVDIWCDDLSDYSYQEVYMALKGFKSTDRSGFAPNVGQLIDAIHSMREISQKTSEIEVWVKIMKAVRNSNYNSEAEFEKLPELAKEVIGTPEALKSMAMNPNFNEGVEKSLFMRSYRDKVEQHREYNRLPNQIKQRLITEANNESGRISG